ncbi:MAG: hypothetical protein AB1503_10620 [Bacillota bacterium]
MPDVSVRAGILNMLADLAAQGAAILFITHDVAVARCLARSIAVMYLGRIVERGHADVLEHPGHPYTRALIASAPLPTRRSAWPDPTRLASSPGSWPPTLSFSDCLLSAKLTA